MLENPCKRLKIIINRGDNASEKLFRWKGEKVKAKRSPTGKYLLPDELRRLTPQTVGDLLELPPSISKLRWIANRGLALRNDGNGNYSLLPRLHDILLKLPSSLINYIEEFAGPYGYQFTSWINPQIIHNYYMKCSRIYFRITPQCSLRLDDAFSPVPDSKIIAVETLPNTFLLVNTENIEQEIVSLKWNGREFTGNSRATKETRNLLNLINPKPVVNI